jgi:acyl dehydratase
MTLYAPRPWLTIALAIGAMAALAALALALPTMGLLFGVVFSVAVFTVPFLIGEWLFEHIESLGRATGRTRAYAAGGGYVAETTTTRIGLWLAGAANLILTALGVLVIAVLNGAVHITW